MPASHHPTALNSIFDTVHRHMRTVKRVIPSVPSIPQPILDISKFKGKEPVSYKLPLGYRVASTPVPPPPIEEPKPNTIKFRPSHTSVKRSRVHFKVTKKVKPEVAKLEQKLSRNISEKKSSLKTPPPKKEQQKIIQTNIINTKTKKSLPQTKADLQMKTQLNKRRNVAQTESLLSQDSAYSERQVKIMKEILRQKEMCSDMLKDYGRLKRSRETLAREMMSMKDYLDDIKSRLDDSVKQLTGSPTVYEKGVAAKRVNLSKKFQDKFRPKTDQRPIKVPNLID